MAFNMVVWNSQGAKWDTFWDKWIRPRAPGGPKNMDGADDVAGLLVESGWAPWVLSGNVVGNNLYALDSSQTWYDSASASSSSFCTNVQANRQRSAMWMPWVNDPDAQTNTRCSMGMVVLPAQLLLTDQTTSDQGLMRPVLRSTFTRSGGGGAALTVLLVHLVSSKNAKKELNQLTKRMAKLIPAGTPGLVVGDMNIDLLKAGYTPPKGWYVLSAGVATQKSGGELDWALLYDPTGQYEGNASADVLRKYKTSPNLSDHSVMIYTIDV